MSDKAKHFDDGKTGLQYVLFMKGLDDVANVGMFGAKKYGQWNYLGGMEYMRVLGSCVRHLTAYIRGVDNDEESGFSHLAHLVYDVLMLMEWQYRKVGHDDRYR